MTSTRKLKTGTQPSEQADNPSIPFRSLPVISSQSDLQTTPAGTTSDMSRAEHKQYTSTSASIDTSSSRGRHSKCEREVTPPAEETKQKNADETNAPDTGLPARPKKKRMTDANGPNDECCMDGKCCSHNFPQGIWWLNRSLVFN